MADIEWILHVDNTDALAKIKQAQLAMAELNRDITGAGDERVKLLENEVDELTKLSEANKKAYSTDKLDQYERSVGSTTETLEDYNEEAEEAGKQTQSMGNIAGKATLIIAGLTLALKTIVSIMKSTGEGADKLKVAIAGVKGGFDQFWRSVATGRFKTLISDMKQASEEARRYQRAMLDLTDANRALSVAEAQTEITIRNLRKILDSDVATLEEKRVAVEGIRDAEEKLNALRLSQSEKAYQNEIKNLQDLYNISEEQFELYVKQDPVFLKQLEQQDRYVALLEKRKILQGIGGKLTEEENIKFGLQNMTLEDVKKALEGVTEAELKAYETTNNLGVPTRDKLNQVTELYIKYLQEQNAEMPLTEDAVKSLNAEFGKQAVVVTNVGDSFQKAYDYAKDYLDLIKKDEEEFVAGLQEVFEKPIQDSQGGTFFLTPEMVREGEKQAKEAYQKIEDAEKDAAERQIEIQKYKWEAIETLASGAINVIANKQQKQYEEELRQIDDRLKYNIEAYADDEEMQTMFYEQAKAEKERLDREYAKKARDLAIIEATIRGALAVAQAWAEEKTWQMALVRSLAAAAAVAVEIATISSQPLAKGGSGDDTGIIKGKRHSEGGERFLDHIEVEGGEAWGVLSRPATAKFGKEFHEIVSSFNRGEMPSITASPVNNSIFVNNDGSNSRLDKLIAEQRSLNEKYGKEPQIIVSGSRKIIRKGSNTRIIG